MTGAALLNHIPGALAADVSNLRCEYLTDPLGVGAAKPRLSWVFEENSQGPGTRGVVQTGYQVLVASTPELLAKDQGDLWDSGKVASDLSSQIVRRDVRRDVRMDVRRDTPFVQIILAMHLVPY